MAYSKTTLALMTKIGLNESANPVIVCGGSHDSDKYIRETGNVLYEASATPKYKTFYTGYNADKNTDEKIHYAYSSDGKTWTKSTSNPVISRRAEDPYVVKSGSLYYLYAEDKQAGGDCYIRRWYSSDCVTWVDEGQITGISNCQSPTVWIEGTTWYMLYERFPTYADIALATSSNGFAWTNEATNPVMIASDTDWVTGDIVCDDVIKVDSTYYMFYHGHDGSVFRGGMAYSTNLTSWTDYVCNPISTDEEDTANKILGANFYYDSEYTFLYLPRIGEADDDLGIYRGYPIAVSGGGGILRVTTGGTIAVTTGGSIIVT